MSFVFETPVGFSACGMAFGAVRKPYSAPCKIFADDRVAENRIHWYIVPDDTPVYEGTSVFWPRVDVPPNEATSAFELEGFGRNCRTFHSGVDMWGFDGDHVHGDPEDFAGETLRAKYFGPGMPDPEETCVGIGVQAGAAFGSELASIPANCPCCDDHVSPDVMYIELECPSLPMFDGHVYTLELVELPFGCQWSLNLDIPPLGPWGLQVTSSTSSPGTLGVAFGWGVSSDPTYTEVLVADADNFDCSPFGFDTTSEILIDGVGTGSMMRLIGSADPITEKFKSRVRFGAILTETEIVTARVKFAANADDVPPPEELTCGAKYTAAIADPPPPEDLDSGAKFTATVTNFYETFTSGVKFNAELDMVEDFTSGVMFNAELDMVEDFTSGVMFNAELDPVEAFASGVMFTADCS